MVARIGQAKGGVLLKRAMEHKADLKIWQSSSATVVDGSLIYTDSRQVVQRGGKTQARFVNKTALCFLVTQTEKNLLLSRCGYNMLALKPCLIYGTTFSLY